MPWSPDAEERLKNVPSFVRGMLTQRVESYARERGYDQVTAEVMQEVREQVMGGRIGNAPPFVRKMLARD